MIVSQPLATIVLVQASGAAGQLHAYLPYEQYLGEGRRGRGRSVQLVGSLAARRSTATRSTRLAARGLAAYRRLACGRTERDNDTDLVRRRWKEHDIIVGQILGHPQQAPAGDRRGTHRQA